MRRPILINVDDHEVARYTRSRLLTLSGFTVHEAGTGAQAIAAAEKYRPDLVLLDVHLPDIHGFEVARILKAQMKEDPFIILQITASAATPAHAAEALQGGADGYLVEPVDPEVLVATVRAMLRLHGAERALAHANRELEIANRELQRSNGDLEHFAFAASHDLQEPLRMISIFAEMIQERTASKLDAVERENLNHVIGAAARMKRLIDDLLAYSKASRTANSWSVIELGHVVERTIKTLQQQIADREATIEVEGELPSVLGDEVQLGQVFQNLLSNALKYARAGRPARVKISAESTEVTKWKILVRDNGVGIAPQYHEIIFAPFRRLHGPAIAGTGIGLSLCRRIIEAHGGKIWVESKPGEGSVFMFTLQAA